MQIPGEGRIKKLLSRKIGNINKRAFTKYILSEEFNSSLDILCKKNKIDIELVTFVNSESFSDLLFSIISFMKVVGVPSKWTLYADNHFSKEQLNILSSIAFVDISKWDERVPFKEKVQYGEKWQLRKFVAYANHPLKTTTIFLDSDIIFYPLFKTYLFTLKNINWYLPEPAEAFNIDADIEKLFDFTKNMYTVNAGFFVINTTPDWGLGFKYLNICATKNEQNYFLDQSALNLMFYHDKDAKVLDPRVFHASANDHFWLSALNSQGFAIRHYVGLIRHKMWQKGWKYLFINK